MTGFAHHTGYRHLVELQTIDLVRAVAGRLEADEVESEDMLASGRQRKQFCQHRGVAVQRDQRIEVRPAAAATAARRLGQVADDAERIGVDLDIVRISVQL